MNIKKMKKSVKNSIKNTKRYIVSLCKRVKSEIKILFKSSFYIVFTNDYFNIFDDRYETRTLTFGPLKLGQAWKYDLHDEVPELDNWISTLSNAVFKFEEDYNKAIRKVRTLQKNVKKNLKRKK